VLCCGLATNGALFTKARLDAHVSGCLLDGFDTLQHAADSVEGSVYRACLGYSLDVTRAAVAASGAALGVLMECGLALGLLATLSFRDRMSGELIAEKYRLPAVSLVIKVCHVRAFPSPRTRFVPGAHVGSCGH